MRSKTIRRQEIPQTEIPNIMNSSKGEIRIDATTENKKTRNNKRRGERKCQKASSSGPISLAKLKKAPGAPRRFKSAFIFFSSWKHRQIKLELNKQGPEKKSQMANVARIVSEEWKNLPLAERKVWEEKAQLDKRRYELEKAMYKGPWRVKARSKKDPTAPKKPMSAYLSYANSKRLMVRSKNPTASNAEVSKKLAAMWREESQEVRQPYIEEEARLREIYKVEIEAWRRNQKSEVDRTQRETLALLTAAHQLNDSDEYNSNNLDAMADSSILEGCSTEDSMNSDMDEEPSPSEDESPSWHSRLSSEGNLFPRLSESTSCRERPGKSPPSSCVATSSNLASLPVIPNSIPQSDMQDGDRHHPLHQYAVDTNQLWNTDWTNRISEEEHSASTKPFVMVGDKHYVGANMRFNCLDSSDNMDHSGRYAMDTSNKCGIVQLEPKIPSASLGNDGSSALDRFLEDALSDDTDVMTKNSPLVVGDFLDELINGLFE